MILALLLAYVTLMPGLGQATQNRSNAPAARETRNPPELDRIRGHIKRGWWEEAARQLDEWLETSVGRGNAEAWLLKAEVCYQRLDVACSYEALDQADRLADEPLRERVSGARQVLQERVGVLELTFQRPAAVDLAPETPLLDPHMDALFRATGTELERLVKNAQPRSGGPKLEWLDPETRTVRPPPPDGPAMVILFLPAGTYLVEGQRVDVTAGDTGRLSLAAPPQTSWPERAFTLGYRHSLELTDPSATAPGLSLELSIAWRRLGLRIEAGGGLIMPPETTQAALSPTAAPSLRLSVFSPIRLSPGWRLEPGVTVGAAYLPYRAFDCVGTHLATGVVQEGTCLSDSIEGVALGGLRIGWRGGPARRLVAELELGGGGTAVRPTRLEGSTSSYYVRRLPDLVLAPVLAGSVRMGTTF